MLDQILDADMFVFYFYYPRFSYTCWFFCQIAIAFWDNEYILSYLVLILIWIVAAYSEFWERNITPILQKLFFRPDLLNEDLMSTNNVMTMFEIMHVKSVNSLLDTEDSEKVMDQTRQ